MRLSATIRAGGIGRLNRVDFSFHPNGGSVDTAEADPRLAASLSVGRAARRESLVDRTTFWLFVAGLAWTPFLYGGNALVAWGVNAMLFPGLVAAYEVSLLLRRKAHPVALRVVAVPAALFAAVLLWILVQTATWLPAFLANPI